MKSYSVVYRERKGNEMNKLEELKSVQFILSGSVTATIIAMSYVLVEGLR